MSDNNLRDILRIQGVMAKGYGIMPKSVMLDKQLTRDAKAIYAYFISYAGAGTTAFPSVGKICEDLGFGTYETYKKHFDLLVKYNYIVVEQTRDKGKFRHNVYTLVDRPQFDEEGIETRDEECASTENKEIEPIPNNPISVKQVAKNSITKNTISKKTGYINNKRSIKSNKNFNKNNINNNSEIKSVDEFSENDINRVKKIIPELKSLDDINTILSVANGDIQKIEEKYILSKKQNVQNLVGFLVDAIKKNWVVTPCEHKQKATFNNFTNRKYDGAELEQLLLQRSRQELI